MPIGVSLKNRRVGVGETAVVIPAGNTVDRPAHPIFGSIRFNIDEGRVEFWDGTTWRNMVIEGTSNIIVNTWTGDGTLSVYTMSETPNSEKDILVFVGNVWQAPLDNYTVSSNQLVLPQNLPNGVSLHVLHNFNSNIV